MCKPSDHAWSVESFVCVCVCMCVCVCVCVCVYTNHLHVTDTEASEYIKNSSISQNGINSINQL